MLPPADNSPQLSPSDQAALFDSHLVGEPRGEEFDLSRLDHPLDAPRGAASHLDQANGQTSESKPKWNHAWAWAAGLLAAYCFYFWVYGLGVRAQRPLPLGPITAKSVSAARVRVHVAGAVKKPGVYALNADARVFDALQQAGGAAPGADPNALNLAAFVEDGAKIEVPLKATPAPKAVPTPIVIIKEVPVPAPAEPPVSSSSASPSRPVTSPGLALVTPVSPGKTAPSGKKDEAQLRLHPVNLNTATLEELQRLPGVGPKMAERIVAFRQENGRFKSLSDLDNVKGIGEKRMDKLGPLVTLK